MKIQPSMDGLSDEESTLMIFQKDTALRECVQGLEQLEYQVLNQGSEHVYSVELKPTDLPFGWVLYT